jgi:hypothetical protein
MSLLLLPLILLALLMPVLLQLQLPLPLMPHMLLLLLLVGLKHLHPGPPSRSPRQLRVVGPPRLSQLFHFHHGSRHAPHGT